MAATISISKRIKSGTSVVDDTVYAYETLANPTLTDDEKQLFQLNGEMAIDFGGTIKNASNVVVAILPTNIRKVPSQLAFSQLFPASMYTDAQAVRDAYAEEIKKRLQAGLVELRTRSTSNNNAITWTY